MPSSAALRAIPVRVARPVSPSRFQRMMDEHGTDLSPIGIDTLQINITKLCNQACRHCHVDASPARKEAMSREAVVRCLELLRTHHGIKVLDITGGAPELHPDFEWLVAEATALGRKVMVRHNLTVTFDGHPLSGASMRHLPAFFAQHGCEVVSSLPYYQEFFTDAQRGSGVFQKSIEGIRALNAVGYGQPDSGLVLNLVYNPVGPYLPAGQAALEADYKRELASRFGLAFNGLFTITNMPINRFRLHLEKSGQYAAYMDRLASAFNPAAAAGVMCRSLISIGWDGTLYDCDFNQQLDLTVASTGGRRPNIFDFDLDALLKRRIQVDDHCLGCTAGAGSSCGGATA